MPGRLHNEDLRPELLLPETKKLMEALLELHVGRVRIVEQFHRKHHPAMGHLDATINLYVFVMREHGTRQQHLIDTLEAPRSSIRTALTRLLVGRLIIRDSRGLYFPALATAKAANEIFPITLREIRRLCEAYQDFLEVCPRPRV